MPGRRTRATTGARHRKQKANQRTTGGSRHKRGRAGVTRAKLLARLDRLKTIRGARRFIIELVPLTMSGEISVADVGAVNAAVSRKLREMEERLQSGVSAPRGRQRRD